MQEYKKRSVVTVLQQLRHSGYLGFLYTRMQKRHRGKETEMAPPFADNSEPVSHHPHYSYCLLFTETKIPNHQKGDEMQLHAHIIIIIIILRGLGSLQDS
jgi:hypothetical protein